MEIESIALVSTLKWKCVNDDCLICNNPIGNNCIKCNQKNSTIKCMSVINSNKNCKHSFHEHCLQQYHKNNSVKCPMCSVSWQY
jgi:RING-box protein 1